MKNITWNSKPDETISTQNLRNLNNVHFEYLASLKNNNFDRILRFLIDCAHIEGGKASRVRYDMKS